MKMVGRAAIAFVMAALCVPLIHAQDLSKYRNFSFGMSAADVSKLAEEKPADVIVIHERPALIQELTWYPPLPFESVRPAVTPSTVRNTGPTPSKLLWPGATPRDASSAKG
jgi:hypothetical protein